MRLVATQSIGDPPGWAVDQRSLIDLQTAAIQPFFDRYTDDGEPYWPPDGYVGVDGGDDLHEGFYNWPLLYLVGGDVRFRDLAKRAFEGILDRLGRTDSGYGHPMVVDEYEQCRDWFHQSEGNLLFYNLCLADPNDEQLVERAERFARLYFPDSESENYDGEHNVMRAPFTGAAGPEYCNLTDMPHHTYGTDYHWDKWGTPFHDVEGIDTVADMMDPDNDDLVADLLADRCGRGDTAISMAASALVANAYLLTGDDAYRDWVREYVGAWCERTRENDGIVPDNMGCSGEVGEHTGAWYGGFYGWSWLGWGGIGAALATAAETAALVTGDDEFLDPLRSTLDAVVQKGITVPSGPDAETRYVPYKHGDPGTRYYHPTGYFGDSGYVLRDDDGEIHYENGWYEFKPQAATIPAHLWFASRDPADREQMIRLRNHEERDHERVIPQGGKHPGGHDQAWLAFLNGEFDGYPEQILACDRRFVRNRLGIIRGYGGEDRSAYEEEYLQSRNPVCEEGLLQLTMGAPEPLYNGGLLQAAIRHFDPDRERPGLPPDVAALVDRIDGDGIGLTLVNLGEEDRRVITQAGTGGEHAITSVSCDGDVAEEDPGTSGGRGRSVETTVPAGRRIAIDLRTDRRTYAPTYAAPWNRGD